MITFKIDNKEVTAPTIWEEVTVKHFINPYFLSGNTIKLLAALTELPADKLANSSEDLIKKFKKTTNFLQKNPGGWLTDTPSELEFMGKKLKVPINLEVKMFGQKIMLQEAFTKYESIYEAIPDAIAIYFGPELYPLDWFDRIDEMKQEVLPLSIKKVGPIASFFLNSFYQLQKSGKIS